MILKEYNDKMNILNSDEVNRYLKIKNMKKRNYLITSKRLICLLV